MTTRRMNLLKLFFISCCLLLISVGCGSKINQGNYDKVQNGMTLEEVKAILGNPTDSKGGGVGPLSGTMASWKDGNMVIEIAFVNNKVQLKTIKSK